MEPNEVKVIVELKALSWVKDLRSFLWLANYYCTFIFGYLRKKIIITNLLKKYVKWAWNAKCVVICQTLKNAIAMEQILKLSDFEFYKKYILMHLTSLVGVC